MCTLHTDRRFPAAVATVIMSVAFASTASADIETATSVLKACVAKHLPNERKKEKPTEQSLIHVCNKPLQDVLRLLPPEFKSDVLDLIESDIAKELKSSDN